MRKTTLAIAAWIAAQGRNDKHCQLVIPDLIRDPCMRKTTLAIAAWIAAQGRNDMVVRLTSVPPG